MSLTDPESEPSVIAATKVFLTTVVVVDIGQLTANVTETSPPNTRRRRRLPPLLLLPLLPQTGSVIIVTRSLVTPAVAAIASTNGLRNTFHSHKGGPADVSNVVLIDKIGSRVAMDTA